MTRTYYDLLGVDPDADAARVRAAYRERVKEVHPDVSDRPDAAEAFRELSAAKETLVDPVERARYDRLGHAAYVGDASPEDDPDADAAAGARAAASATRDRSRRRDRRRGKHTRAGRAARERADAWASGRDDAWWRTAETESAWDGATTASTGGSGRAGRSTATDRSGYRVSTRAESAVGFTVERGLLAVAVFFCYPMLLGVAVLPPFAFGIRVAAAVVALLLVAHTLSVPESGVLVFGALTAVAPPALTLAGIGLFSVTGVVAWAFCWVPLVIAGANLLALRG
ncbi:DnaJ domain-containing protein [Halosegnis marinus]|uniref:DnaJ domain-containing protein n=1 Tax=Halosegnis marinus TaxID=3034023 RepID=A0ABD5ZSJ9_9EURY|nr:DnaJ domain-containing protein [Halosegnis sp. DT85]